MKAAVLKDLRTIVVEDVQVPQPAAHEVRLRVRIGGICGSDSSIYQGKYSILFPIIPGHEAVGVIDTLGPVVSGKFHIGQRVTIHPNYFCGTCPLCKKGLTNICSSKIRLGIDTNGVFAEYVVAPETALCPLPDNLADEVAVFAEPLAVAAHAINLYPLKRNDRVLVFGAGVIGQLTMQMALLKSRDITACDLIASRLELARKMGAKQTIGDPDSFSAYESNFDVVYETSGAPAALEMAINMAAPGGSIILLGIPGHNHTVPTVQIVRKELKIFGSMVYTQEIPECIEILSKGLINTIPLVSGLISLDQLGDSLENFNAPNRMKTLIRI